MLKKLLFVLLFAVGFTACKNSTDHKPACSPKACTAVFGYIGVVFNNKDGSPAQIKDATFINLRTGKPVEIPPYPPADGLVAGFVLIASDGARDQFSTEGDDIQITATSVATGQVKTFVIKLSGGCNCHVEKLAGPEKVVFE